MNHRITLLALLAVCCAAGCRQGDTPVTSVKVDSSHPQNTYSSPQQGQQQATPPQQKTGYDNLRDNPNIPQQAKDQVLGGR